MKTNTKCKKYTIIYTETIRVSSMRMDLVKCDRVTTYNISNLLKDPRYDGCTCFVFEGHPKQEGE